MSGFSCVFIHLKDLLHCHRHMAEEQAILPVPQPFISLPTSQSFPGDLYKTALNRDILGVCDRGISRLLCRCLKICDQVLQTTKTTAFSTGQRWELRCRN